MLVECQCQPSNIELSCSSIVKLGLWKRREVFALLSVLFSHVSHLLIEEYEADSYYNEQCNDESPLQQMSEVFRYLLESVFCGSKRRPTVTDFQVIPDTEDFLVGALHHMAYVMSSRTSCSGWLRQNKILQKSVTVFMHHFKVYSVI